MTPGYLSHKAWRAAERKPLPKRPTVDDILNGITLCAPDCDCHKTKDCEHERNKTRVESIKR